MKQEAVRDLENLYGQTMRFLESEGIAERPPVSGPNRTEYRNQLPRRAGKVSLKGQSAAAAEGDLRPDGRFFLIPPRGTE